MSIGELLRELLDADNDEQIAFLVFYGRPAYYRWRPLFNAAVWLTPTIRVPCSNAAKTRNPLNFAGVPKTNETISAASVPKFTIL